MRGRIRGPYCCDNLNRFRHGHWYAAATVIRKVELSQRNFEISQGIRRFSMVSRALPPKKRPGLQFSRLKRLFLTLARGEKGKKSNCFPFLQRENNHRRDPTRRENRMLITIEKGLETLLHICFNSTNMRATEISDELFSLFPRYRSDYSFCSDVYSAFICHMITLRLHPGAENRAHYAHQDFLRFAKIIPDWSQLFSRTLLNF